MTTQSIELSISSVNTYLAYKQCLLILPDPTGVLQVTRDLVALHATSATSPYLSLWARLPGFSRSVLDKTLYERRELVRMLCMRSTLHIVPGDEMPAFFQAYAELQTSSERRSTESLLVQAGLCQPEETGDLLRELHSRVLEILDERGPSTVREISQAMPELGAKVRHDVGKPYQGEFSIGSRLIPGMCTLGLLIRARPRGTWRSNLYEYAPLRDWLPAVDLASTTPQEAQLKLVHHYLSVFGPATFADILWWTGLSKSRIEDALLSLTSETVKVTIEGSDNEYIMLVEDIQRMSDFVSPTGAYVFLLPALDPYIMGYQERSRFLASEHSTKVLDRAGNAMPTVWVNGRVVGAWKGRRDGSVVCGLFENVDVDGQGLLEGKRHQLEDFLDGEYISQPNHTPFTRTLK